MTGLMKTEGAMSTAQRKVMEKKMRREAILSSARTVLIAKGFSSTTMQDVADAAGLSVGTLYLYFRDKESIFVELYTEGMRELEERITGACGGIHSPEEKIEMMAMAYFRFHNEQRSLFDAFSYFFSFPEILFKKPRRKALALRGRMILSLVQSAIEEGIKGKIFRKTDPQREALVLWSSLHGILQVEKMRDVLFPEYGMEDVYRYQVKKLIKGLLV
ncbi:MAG: hypothetical protein CVV27_21990 [Candidatus Melainabacteria bacterium HGW-Melainabacteria-1]|nr:MAG: hypothetical protein CVV27_21990 [Candidatus Melainabacteria bacterium HGW-Melainabacteria-1]